MNASQVKKALKIAIAARISALLWGNHGCGKSQIVHELAKELYGIGNNGFPTCIDLRLGQMEVGDLIGIPRNAECEDGVIRTIYGKPGWFPVKGEGVLFLDEINRAGTQDVLQAIFQLVFDYRLHTHVLPEGWRVIAAANPPDGEYQVQILDPALMDRFVHFWYSPEHKEWLMWAGHQKISPEITGFVNAHPKALGLPEKPFELNITPSPRSYELLHKMFTVMDEATREEIGFQIMCGCIGQANAVIFQKYMQENYEKPIPGKQILTNFAKHKKDIERQSAGKQTRMDLLKATCTDIIIYAKEKQNLLPREIKNLASLLKTIPGDLSFAVINELLENNLENIYKEVAKDGELTEKLKTAIHGKKKKPRINEVGENKDENEPVAEPVLSD